MSKSKTMCGDGGKRKSVQHVRRILIVKPSSFGDIIHTFKAVQLLHENYPKAVIDWLVNPAFAELLDYAPVEIARKIPFKRKQLGNVFTFLPEFIKLVFQLRKIKYDMIFDFQGLLRSALFSKIACSKRVVGFANPREKGAIKFYNRRVELPEGCRQAVERNLALARSYCKDWELESPLHIPVIQHNRDFVKSKLKRRNISYKEGIVAIFPGARWESKRFPTAMFANLINQLHEKYPQYKFLLLGSSDEAESAEAIVQATGDYVSNIAGATKLGGLVELLRLCKLVVANDSGPLHLAAALGCPTMAFYGPTDPTYTGPDGENVTVFQPNVECKNCLNRVCPDGSYKCHQLDEEQILKTAVYKLDCIVDSK